MDVRPAHGGWQTHSDQGEVGNPHSPLLRLSLVMMHYDASSDWLPSVTGMHTVTSLQGVVAAPVSTETEKPGGGLRRGLFITASPVTQIVSETHLITKTHTVIGMHTEAGRHSVTSMHNAAGGNTVMGTHTHIVTGTNTNSN